MTEELALLAVTAVTGRQLAATPMKGPNELTASHEGEICALQSGGFDANWRS
jgi:hypothetical protein